MVNDLARVTIQADDETKSGIDSAARNIQGLYGAFDALKSRIAALGGLLGISAFADMIAHTIEAQSHLDDLAKSSSIAAEKLAGLKLAAQVSGTDLDTVALSVNRLAQNIGKNADAFHALGISTKDPLQAFLQLTDVLSRIQDPTLRAAVASTALGKGWQEVAPLLNEGSARIRALVDEGTRLSNVTSQSAAAANELNKHWLELVGSGGLLNAVVNKMVPLMDSLVSAALRFRDAGLGDKILDVAQAAVRFFTPLGAIANALGLYSKSASDAGSTTKQLTGGMAMWASAGDQVSRKAASDAAAAANAFLASQKDAADAAKVQAFYEQTVARVRGEVAIADAQAANGASQLTQAERELLALHQNPIWAKLTPDQKAYLNTILQGVAVKQQDVQITQAQLAAQQALDQADADTMAQVQEIMNRGQDRLAQANATVESYKEEIATLGLSDAARQQVLLGLQKEKALRGVLNPDTRQGIENAYAEAQAYAAQYAQLQQQLSVWGELGDKAGHFFSDLAEHGRKAFGDLRNMVKQLLADMVALFVKKWVLQLGATALMGTAAGTALGNEASSVGGNTLAGGLLNSVGGNLITSVGSNLISGAALSGGSGLLGGTGSTILGSSFSTTLFGSAGLTDTLAFTGTGISGAVGSAAVAAGASAETAAAIASWVPVIGWVVAIGAVLYAAFGRKGGAPKVGGSFMGSFDASGALTGTPAVPGSDNGRFYTPNQQDAQAKQIVLGVNQGFQAMLQAFGGKSSGISFGFGMDADPGGTAQSRLSAMVQDSQGRVLLNILNRSFDDKETQAQAALAISQMILAGLQASDLPKAVANVLNSIDAASATQDQINNLEAVAQSVGLLTGALSDAIDPTQILAASSRSAMDVFHAQGEALVQLAKSSSLTTDSLGNLITATGQYRDIAAQLIAQLQQAEKQVGSTIDSAERGMRLGSLDQQGQYNFLQEEARQLAGGINSLTDAQAIIDAVNQITQDSNQAFGMLSDADKQAQLADFVKGLEDVRAAADQRLHDLQDQAANDANSELAQMRQAITDLTQKLADSADTQKDASSAFKGSVDKFAGAVDKGIDVRVTPVLVPQGGGA